MRPTAVRQHSRAVIEYDHDEQSDSTSDGEVQGAKQHDALLLKAARRLQRAFRTRRFVVAVEKMMMLNKKRKFVLREIVSSEKVYSKTLDALVGHFVRPLQAVLSPDVLELCFPGVQLIAALHRDSLPRVETLGPDLLALASRLEPAYGPHVVHLARATKSMQAQLATHAKARAIVEAAVSENQCLRGEDYLSSLLIGPTQRLARYPLLLREVLKFTSDSHRDAEQLKAALELFSRAASQIDAAKKNEDQLRRKLFLASHASAVTRAVHVLAAEASSSVHMCAVCERAIWGVSRKHFKCGHCKCKVHIECKAPALCGAHCEREARLDLSQETILSEYFVQAVDGRRGYVLLTSRGASWGEAQGAAAGLDSSEGAVEVARSVKWKELQIEEMKTSDGPKHFALALFARQVPRFEFWFGTVTERTAFIAMLHKTQSEETAKAAQDKAALQAVSGPAARTARDLRHDRKKVGLKKSPRVEGKE